jgi:threonine/homoserine/homoserine lactone efflux protein
LLAVRPAVLLTFWALVAVLVIVPGPDWAFTLGAGVRDQVVLPAVAGLLLGYLAITAVVAAGVGAVVAGTPAVLSALTVVGAAYLIYLGGGLLARPGADGALVEPAGGAARRRWSVLVRGVGVSGLNPKGLLLFLAVLPQFTDPDHGWPEPVQLTVLGLVFVATCGLFYTALGLCARSVLRARPRTGRVVSRVSGSAMVLIGLVLLGERLLAR